MSEQESVRVLKQIRILLILILLALLPVTLAYVFPGLLIWWIEQTRENRDVILALILAIGVALLIAGMFFVFRVFEKVGDRSNNAG